MADGFTFNSLIESLSAMGSASSNLADLSATGKGARVRPLVDYNDFFKTLNLSKTFLSFACDFAEKTKQIKKT